MVATLREDLYHADGQIMEEVYVYGSFLQSKMHRAGVRCTHCHNPHTAELVVEGNKLCVRCHQKHPTLQLKSDAFEAIRLKDYDSPGHHFHEPGSSGSRCINCHMLEKTYMVVDPRRDHSFRVPRPDLSVKLGTPNACNACHEDQSPQWASAAVEKWYGPRRPSESDFAQAFSRGRAGDPDSTADLIRIAHEPSQPAIVRATALELLMRYDSAGTVAAMIAGTKSLDPLLRTTATRGLELLPPEFRLTTVAPFLGDPIRSVRMQAASTLSSVPADLFDPEQKKAFAAAVREYEDLQVATADRPGAHLNLGLLHASRKRLDLAEQSYQSAIRMDGNFMPARVNLANLFNQTGRNAEAERLFRETIARFPEEGELRYSLGLLLAEEGQLEESAQALAKAVELMPARPRVRYNYSLALQQLGQQAEAEAAMLAAYAMTPEDPSILEALIAFYSSDGHWKEARTYAEELARLFPDAPQVRQLLERIGRNSEQ
jgi:predicted CXXCH cytochrome family protein